MTFLVSAADVLGVPDTVVVGVLTAIVGFGGSWLSTRQARGASHDQVLATRDANLWARMEQHSAHLEGRVDTLAKELSHAEDRIDQLEAAMRADGVAVPPRRYA